MSQHKHALIIIDMLNDFLVEGAPLEVPAARNVVPFIREKLEIARKEGMVVIYICDSHRKDDPEFERMNWPPHAIEGTGGAQVIDELKPLPGDKIVTKTTYSGFFKTDLDKILGEPKISTLLVCGCVTNICVLYTVAEAVMRGYEVEVFKEGVAGLNQEDHDFALRQMEEVLGAKITT